jgi:hypothetical protein
MRIHEVRRLFFFTLDALSSIHSPKKQGIAGIRKSESFFVRVTALKTVEKNNTEPTSIF